ncbi:MAG: response regulator [Chloroflexi bacterium]|nr:response regulator [Chloroflexota bacterium]
MRKKARILVVDDNVEFCENLKELLELEGHDVLTAYSGRQAVELAHKGHFDLVVLDLVMPGIDGVTTIKAIRKTGSSVPITMVTAFGEEEQLSEALKAGVGGFVRKPFDFDAFLSDIKKSIQPRKRH